MHAILTMPRKKEPENQQICDGVFLNERINPPSCLSIDCRHDLGQRRRQCHRPSKYLVADCRGRGTLLLCSCCHLFERSSCDRSYRKIPQRKHSLVAPWAASLRGKERGQLQIHALKKAPFKTQEEDTSWNFGEEDENEQKILHVSS